MLYVKVGNTELIARADARDVYQPGSKVELTLNVAKVTSLTQKRRQLFANLTLSKTELF